MALSVATKEGIYINQILNELCDETIGKVLKVTGNKIFIKLVKSLKFLKSSFSRKG